MKFMPSWSCPGTGSTIGSPMVPCASDNSGKKWQGMKFVKCVYEETTKQKVTGNSDWPPALTFTDDWNKKINTRAYTVLTDTNIEDRRKSVGVAMKGGPGATPIPLPQMMAMAQSEWLAWNQHEDLWHMDWRARLVPFTFGDTTDGNTSGADGHGVPSGSSGIVSSAISGFLKHSGTASLKDQFLLH
jgi:hypothetical protein